MNHVMIVGWDTTSGHPVSIPTGTANIGNVGIIAGSASIGTIYKRGDQILYGAVTTTVQSAVIQTVTSAAQQIAVTSVSAKTIVVIGAVLAGSPAMTLQFFSAATTESGPIAIGAGVPLVMPRNDAGWLKTNAGESLTYTPSVSGNFGGLVNFIVV